MCYTIQISSTDKSHEQNGDDNAKPKTVQNKKDNGFPWKGYRMSVFLSITFLVIVGVVASIAISNWQKGSYWAAFSWGIAAYLLFGVGIFFTYYSYVIVPAKQAAAARPEGRPHVFIKLTRLKYPLMIGESPIIQIVLKNSGSEEAHVRFWDNTFSFRMLPFNGTFEYIPAPATTFDIEAGAEINGEFKTDFLVTKDRLDALQSGRARLHFFIRGEYRDRTGIAYPLPFCRIYDKDMNGNLIFCSEDIIVAERDVNRGYVRIANIQPTPPSLKVGEGIKAYITWANEGASPAEVNGGYVRFFVSLMRPSEVMIPCAYEGHVEPIAPVEIGPRSRRIQRFVSPNIFAAEDINAVNGVANARSYFGICGRIEYVTLGKTFPFEFCTYYDPDEKTYIDCKNPPN